MRVLALCSSLSLYALLANGESIDCKKFDHARAYWVDDDGVTHWRSYSFSSDCTEVKVQKWAGDVAGESYTDQLNGGFLCLKDASEPCLNRFRWYFESPKTIVSVTENIEFVSNPHIQRKIKEAVTRSITLKDDATLAELLVFDTYYKDSSDNDWFNVRTERSRCQRLTLKPECQWDSAVRR